MFPDLPRQLHEGPWAPARAVPKPPHSEGFDPVCYAIPLPAAGHVPVHFSLGDFASRPATAAVGAGRAEPVPARPVPQGIIVLNQQAEGTESAIAASFFTDDVRQRLQQWEITCRSSARSAADADWYCARRHQHRTHVLAGVLLEGEALRSLPPPEQVMHIARAAGAESVSVAPPPPTLFLMGNILVAQGLRRAGWAIARGTPEPRFEDAGAARLGALSRAWRPTTPDVADVDNVRSDGSALPRPRSQPMHMREPGQGTQRVAGVPTL